MMNRAAVALLATLSGTAGAQLPVDSALAAFIGRIRAVDNHSHVNTAVPRDSEFDALPLDGLLPSPTPVRLRPDNPELIGVYRTLYDYPYADLSDAHLTELRATMARVQRERGTSFPEWLLDKAGIEVMLANRIAMGPGLAPPRFRWVSYVDALMLPLATTAERAATPDYAALYPLEDRLLRRYMKDLGLARLPATLDAYLRTVVTPTLERQRREGCVAVKFEIAYLRALDFDAASRAAANVTYARYVAGGAPPRGEYRNLENFLFRYIARESGRLGMAVHIHSFEGGGGYYSIAGSDPLLLEPAFNDSSLRRTNFVIVHGGGMYAAHAGALLSKPNVYLDISAMTIVYSAATLAPILRSWLEQYPEKVLFGTDAWGTWDVYAVLGTETARRALGVALTAMMRDGDVTRERAQELATMVLRTNASGLYDLHLR